MMHFCHEDLFLSLQTVQTRVQHFIWVFTVCQSTGLLISRRKRVKYLYLMFTFKTLPLGCEKHDIRNVYIFVKPILTKLSLGQLSLDVRSMAFLMSVSL